MVGNGLPDRCRAAILHPFVTRTRFVRVSLTVEPRQRHNCCAMYDVIAMGETMVAFEAQQFGPLREAEDFKKWVGGAADNFIIAVARLGFTTGWFSRVGDDELGRFIVRWIRGEGVDVSRTVVDSTKPTGLFLVERRSTVANFKCWFYRSTSAATNVCPEDIDEGYLSQAKYIYPEGIMLYVSDSARRAVQKMFDVAGRHNREIIFDPNLRLTMASAEESRALVIPLMQRATYCLPGEDELRMIMNESETSAAIRKAHNLGIEKLIVKAGAGGAILAPAGREPQHMPGFKLSRFMSPMGAGDCFVGGFTAGLLKEQPLETCVRWGNAVGAFNTMAYGPFHACPSFDELQSFLEGVEKPSR
jgi:2-dehydro-3-deoxygluconokinase